MIAGDIIEAARDVHPAFDQRHSPDRLLLRALTSYQRELVGKIAAVNESAIVASQIVTLPLANFGAGITLNPYDYLNGATLILATDPDEKRRLDIIPWAARTDPGPWPSAWIHGGVMYLQGRAVDWQPWSQLVISYVPLAADLVALSTALIVPDTARSTLVGRLARVMGRRGHTDQSLPPIPLQVLEMDAEAQEQAFLRDVFLRRGAQTIITREVR